MDLIIENIRTFVGRHVIPIKPLTVLVGENSTGKSTLLACLATLGARGYPLTPRFNDPPYNLGTFKTILSNVTSPDEKSFKIGFKGPSPLYEYLETEASYTEIDGKIKLKTFLCETDDAIISIKLRSRDNKYNAHLTDKGRNKPKIFRCTLDLNDDAISKFELDFLIYRELVRRFSKYKEMISNLTVQVAELHLVGVESVAPIRSKPNRTYDSPVEGYDPEGAHIPFLLARLLAKKNPTERDRWKQEFVQEFGISSGLYKSLRVKRLGRSITDPFQILVTTSKKPANLIDVGYGVSQMLPVILQAILSDDPNILLLQQPEVHLHPRAQAQLGSLFSILVGLDPDGFTFIVETHSDFILDRIRQETGKGNIKPDLISILFLENDKGATKIHPLSLDESGNIQNAPPSYRQFFLEEELDLLTRTSDYD